MAAMAGHLHNAVTKLQQLLHKRNCKQAEAGLAGYAGIPLRRRAQS